VLLQLSCAVIALVDWQQNSPLSTDEISQRVQAGIEQELGTVEAAKRSQYAKKLTAALIQISPSPRTKEVLDALPRALEFHASMVKDYEDRADLSDASTAELFRSAYDTEMEYLAARIDRAMRKDRSDAVRAQVYQQIDVLFSTAKDTLKAKLLGPAADNFIERHFDELRTAWQQSFDSPFNACLDRPLSPGDLEILVSGIRSSTDSFSPVLLTDVDFLNNARLQALGVTQLLEGVRTAVYASGKACFSDYAALQAASNKYRAAIKEAIKQGAIRKDEREKPPGPSEQSRPTKSPGITSIPQKPESPVIPNEGASSSPVERKSKSQDVEVSRGPTLVFVGITLALGLLILLWLKRRNG
jgi:hypothetical protein